MGEERRDPERRGDELWKNKCKNLNKTGSDLKQLAQSRAWWRVKILCSGRDQENEEDLKFLKTKLMKDSSKIHTKFNILNFLNLQNTSS